jgi:hypothetical protein
LADGRPIFSTTARVYPGFNNILTAESAGNSSYNALNLTVEKRWGHNCQIRATYTWSHAIDDAPEQNNIDSSSFLSDPTNRVFQTQFDASHRVARRFLNHNQLSFALQAASGDLFNIGSNRQLNQDADQPAAFQRPLFIGRNTLRAPSVFELNVRYSRIFSIKEQYNLEFLAETTNLTNTLSVTGVDSTAQADAAGNVLLPASGAAIGARDQRLVQLGIRLTF